MAKRVSQLQQGDGPITTHISSSGFEDQKTIATKVNSEDMYRMNVMVGLFLMESFHDYVPTGFFQLNWLVCRNTSVSLYHPNLWRNAEKRYSSPTLHHFSISDLRQLVWSPRIFGRFEDLQHLCG